MIGRKDGDSDSTKIKSRNWWLERQVKSNIDPQFGSSSVIRFKRWWGFDCCHCDQIGLCS